MAAKYETLGGSLGLPWAGMTGGPNYLLGRPGPTGFGSASTAEQVASGWDGQGKVVLLTGASSGLGAEAARVLSARGATLVLLVRNLEATNKVVEEIKAARPTADVRVIKCDLTSLPSVANAARSFLDMKLPLHVLMLNAGVMAPPYMLTEQGLESQIGTNHVAHALLARYLLPQLVKTASTPGAPEGRIVVLSSTGHHLTYGQGVLPDDQISSKEKYSRWPAYGQSKLANVLFARELAARLKAAGVSNVAAVCCHPGVIPSTELPRHIGRMGGIMQTLMRPIMKSIPAGAATQVYLATAPGHLPGGEYYADCNLSPSSPHAHNVGLSQRLWRWTEQQVAPFLDREVEAQQPVSWVPSA